MKPLTTQLITVLSQNETPPLTIPSNFGSLHNGTKILFWAESLLICEFRNTISVPAPRHDYILFSLTHGYNNCLFIGPKFSPANRPFRSPAFLCTAAPPAIPHARDITALVRRQPGCRWQQDQTDAASNAKSYTPGNV